MRRIKNAVVSGGLSATVAVAALTGCKTTAHELHYEGNAASGFNDTKIASEIRAKLKGEPTYKFDSVEVSSSGGVVRLKGLVSHPDQRRRAEEIARNTAGVTEVLNGLVLSRSWTPSPAGYTADKLFSEPPANQKTAQPNF